MSTLINFILALVLQITGAQIAQQPHKVTDACKETIIMVCDHTLISKNEQNSTKNHTNEH